MLLLAKLLCSRKDGQCLSCSRCGEQSSREFTVSSSVEMASVGTWRDSVHGAARGTSVTGPPGSGAAGVACCCREPTVGSSLEEKRCRVIGSWRPTVHFQTCSWS